MELSPADQLIVSLIREGKNTLEVAKILTEKGYRTPKGDYFIRKTVNNRLLFLRNKGINLKKSAETSETKSRPINSSKETRREYYRLKAIKPFIFETKTGKIRVRKYLNGKVFTKTFLTVSDAEKYLAQIGVTKEHNPNEDRSLPQLSKIKTEPKLSKLENMNPFFEQTQQQEDSSFIFIQGKNIKGLADLLIELRKRGM